MLFSGRDQAHVSMTTTRLRVQVGSKHNDSLKRCRCSALLSFCFCTLSTALKPTMNGAPPSLNRSCPAMAVAIPNGQNGRKKCCQQRRINQSGRHVSTEQSPYLPLEGMDDGPQRFSDKRQRRGLLRHENDRFPDQNAAEHRLDCLLSTSITRMRPQYVHPELATILGPNLSADLPKGSLQGDVDTAEAIADVEASVLSVELERLGVSVLEGECRVDRLVDIVDGHLGLCVR